MAGWFSNMNLDQIGAQVTGLTQSLGESAAKMGEDLQQKVNTLAAFDLEEINKAIQNAEEDITSKEAKIQQEDAGLKQAEIKILPWETRIEKMAILSHGLMEKILSLSLEESNFTTPPLESGTKPEEISEDSALQGNGGADDDRNGAAAFQLDRHTSVAIKMLSLDPNLAKIHARLISRMPERTFWYHYFSRVATLRAEVDLEPLCEDLSKEHAETTTSEEYDKISHGDVQSMTSPSELANETDHKRVGEKDKTNDDDNDDDDDEYSDLGDLDDLDDGASDTSIDAALEAEIAAELGEG
ncbi:unnamed protein product [Ectocarpus sp. 6 AP-2014]